jgi:hypothetical protein
MAEVRLSGVNIDVIRTWVVLGAITQTKENRWAQDARTSWLGELAFRKCACHACKKQV